MFLQMDPNLAGNRKARRLKRLLDIYDRDVAGLLYSLWSHALAHCADGVLADHTPADLADICEWPGDGGDLVEAFIASGFLERLEDGDGFVVASWSEHTGGALTRRAEKKDRERQRSAQRRAESSKKEEKPTPTENDRRSKTVDQERPQKTAPELNGTELNGTEQTHIREAPSIESILAGEHDEDPKLLGRKATRIRLIEWHCKLWGGNPKQFKPNAKDITGTLKGLQADGYKPSEVARAMRGMRKDPWDGRCEHNGWPSLRRHMRKWLEFDAGEKRSSAPSGVDLDPLTARAAERGGFIREGA